MTKYHICISSGEVMSVNRLKSDEQRLRLRHSLLLEDCHD